MPRPGICFVTRAPGATHAATGVYTAFQDSTPLVLFVGQVPLAHRGREALQELAYEQFFGGLAERVVEAKSTEELPELTARAFSVAASGRPGPRTRPSWDRCTRPTLRSSPARRSWSRRW